VSSELDFIAALRRLAGDPAARGLSDDVAVLPVGGGSLVLTHDMIVEGIHYLATDQPEDVAWKLVAVNLSDLAAKGAAPLGVLLGYVLHADEAWNLRFRDGLAEVLDAFGVPLLGGDTVRGPAGAPLMLGLTAIGEVKSPVPSRSGAKEGDLLWVSGTIGDAGAGLRIARGDMEGPPDLALRYRRPTPRLALGTVIAPLVHAAMDVSDGLLLDAARMAEASGLSAALELEAVPLSASLIRLLGDSAEARVDAAVAGDDYELLFAAPPETTEAIAVAAAEAGTPITTIGRFRPGSGIVLSHEGKPHPLPDRLGYQHESVRPSG